MKTTLLNILRNVRAVVMKKIKPKDHYYLAKNTQPISDKFGYDRGTPINRYYIEHFLDENKKLIKGRCLEVVDNNYTKRFGGERVVKSDILDNDKSNKQATIIDDLKNLVTVKDNTFDCLVITQTLGMIDEFDQAIKECKRILKPGGVLLLTVSAMSPVLEVNESTYWRFTVAGAKYAFGKYFSKDKLEVKSCGNALAGQSFWVGLALEELTEKEIAFNDPQFPVIITVKATK